MHYQRMVAHGSATAPVQYREAGRGCSIEGCDGPHSAKGYCQTHYSRLRDHGSPLAEVQFRGPDEVRFWAKVEKAGPDDCWHWKIKKGLNQYGQFRSSELKRPIGAHAFSFYLANHYVPPEVMHKCDVRSCVNPRHLQAGTRKLNMADMKAKGRAPIIERKKGEAHHAAKLTEADVRAIRVSTETHASLARKYGVTVQVLRAARMGKTWKHIE
ncbi:hypothetical protein SH584_11475 [Sphingomonas sp. LY29]|uniref:hypothetical protein n=1 Tax=Sphingomonas sp. LY29 TaxID=3095341 RepID=UPI002D782633|nr:hypothetical protein [Sphingomonas sp. LY29]WRP25652.1 hypothetical protein SH584_11475 [Sphingomonas sp. LY29]